MPNALHQSDIADKVAFQLSQPGFCSRRFSRATIRSKALACNIGTLGAQNASHVFSGQSITVQWVR